MENFKQVGMYKRGAISFAIATVIFLVVVVLIVLPNATITIKPIEDTIERSFNFSISEKEAEAQEEMELFGTINSIEITSEKTFTSSGKVAISSDIEGTITIRNEYSKDQPLVATTRFITEGGTLLRLKDPVTVPRGGSVEASVYLDPNEKGVSEISTGKLIIPGLWEGLQDKIYGEVAEPLTGPTLDVTAVSEKDIIDAHQEVRTLVENAAIESLKKNLKESQEFDADTISEMELADITIVEELWKEDSAPGTEAETFTVTGTFVIEGMFYKPEDVRQKLQGLLVSSLSEGESIIFDNGTVDVSLIGSGEESTALIEWSGMKQNSILDSLIESSNIIGKSRKEAEAILNASPSVEFARIDLSPFWVDKVPKNIEIIFE